MCATMAGPPKAVIPRRRKEPKIAAALGLGEAWGERESQAVLCSLIQASSLNVVGWRVASHGSR